MERLLLIAVVALVVYLVRLSGFALAALRLGPDLRRELALVPVAVLAALVAVTARGPAGSAGLRLLVLGAAGLLCWKTRQPWAGLVAGMVVFWLLRWLSLR
jgi:branched-subunit amino acid transport protein